MNTSNTTRHQTAGRIFSGVVAALLIAGLSACGVGNDAQRQQEAECPEGCIILDAERSDGLRCAAGDPDCCELNDPTCSGADASGPYVDPCAPSEFLGTSFLLSEESMNGCYGMWRYRTEAVVSYCPSDKTAWVCPVAPLEFTISGGMVIAYTGAY